MRPRRPPASTPSGPSEGRAVTTGNAAAQLSGDNAATRLSADNAAARLSADNGAAPVVR